MECPGCRQDINECEHVFPCGLQPGFEGYAESPFGLVDEGFRQVFVQELAEDVFEGVSTFFPVWRQCHSKGCGECAVYEGDACFQAVRHGGAVNFCEEVVFEWDECFPPALLFFGCGVEEEGWECGEDVGVEEFLGEDWCGCEFLPCKVALFNGVEVEGEELGV